MRPGIETTRHRAYALTPLFALLATGTVPACGSDSGEPSGSRLGTSGMNQAGMSADLALGSGGATALGGSRATSSAPGRAGGGSLARGGGDAGRARGGGAGAFQSAGAPGTAGSNPGGMEATAGATIGPPPRPDSDGSSAYLRECHGNSLDCVDPSLRCLGIRDGSQIFGYACSNLCRTLDDCSSAQTGTDAFAGCVDFIASKHCLLVCQNGERSATCPDGMACHVYPGTKIGYCLWP